MDVTRLTEDEQIALAIEMSMAKDETNSLLFVVTLIIENFSLF